MTTTYTSRDLAWMALRVADMMDAAAQAEDEESRAAIEDEARILLDTFDGEAPEKLDALRAVALRLDAEADTLRAEEKRLAMRRRSVEAGAERVMEYARMILSAKRELDGEAKVRSTTGSYWLQASESVRGPETIEHWPEGWRRVKVEPDRAAALKAHRNGEALPEGFTIERTESVRWR